MLSLNRYNLFVNAERRKESCEKERKKEQTQDLLIKSHCRHPDRLEFR